MNDSHRGESLGLTLLLILFVALKLTGYIDWSWWWVLSPIWIPLVFLLCLYTAIGVALYVAKSKIGGRA